MSVNYLRISSCGDPNKWYFKCIGQFYEIIPDPYQYKNREWCVRASDGYLNFVDFADCAVWTNAGDILADGVTRVIDLPPAPAIVLTEELRNQMVVFGCVLDNVLDQYPDYLRVKDSELWYRLVDLSIALETCEDCLIKSMTYGG